ncbi:hypothetical protein RhiirA5_347759 [Rhizophagus irregularis]|uniref:Uncharacterized protein n=2 Tax=Rhizophagus irregularis TaxID=588596 RepID=A0A2N0QBG8_9GLOM|nr:hypothetical protein RhiirA5_347759 [Rhizophagus irregularis]
MIHIAKPSLPIKIKILSTITITKNWTMTAMTTYRAYITITITYFRAVKIISIRK